MPFGGMARQWKPVIVELVAGEFVQLFDSVGEHECREGSEVALAYCGDVKRQRRVEGMLNGPNSSWRPIFVEDIGSDEDALVVGNVSTFAAIALVLNELDEVGDGLKFRRRRCLF